MNYRFQTYSECYTIIFASRALIFKDKSLIIYEVNLIVNNEIYKEYYEWLIQHIKIMLTFSGFIQAELAAEIHDGLEMDVKSDVKTDVKNQRKNITVRYTLENEQSLENYLKNYAHKMRKDGINKFGDQFTAFRRIFKEPILIN